MPTADQTTFGIAEPDMGRTLRGRVTVYRWSPDLQPRPGFLAVLRRANVTQQQAAKLRRDPGSVVLWVSPVQGVRSVLSCVDPVLLSRWKQERATGRLHHDMGGV